MKTITQKRKLIDFISIRTLYAILDDTVASGQYFYTSSDNKQILMLNSDNVSFEDLADCYMRSNKIRFEFTYNDAQYFGCHCTYDNENTIYCTWDFASSNRHRENGTITKEPNGYYCWNDERGFKWWYGNNGIVLSNDHSDKIIFDENGRIIRVTNPSGTVSDITYFYNGNVKSIVKHKHDELKSKEIFNIFGRVVMCVWRLNCGYEIVVNNDYGLDLNCNTERIDDYTPECDVNGNITSFKCVDDTNMVCEFHCDYDTVGRPLCTKITDNKSTSVTYYEYDGGNIHIHTPTKHIIRKFTDDDRLISNNIVNDKERQDVCIMDPMEYMKFFKRKTSSME